jgi:hypothetical protein
MGRSDGETHVRELDMREAEGVKFFQGWELVGDKQKLARGL